MTSAAAPEAARATRAGEELDLAKLSGYLAEHLPQYQGPLEVEQFRGGHSNLTYLLRLGDTELVLRRPPFSSKVKTAHDMGREVKILSALQGVYPKAPRPLHHCQDASVLGAPFYLMERVRGLILRGPSPKACATFDEATFRRVSTALVDGLAELHQVDVAAAGLSDLGRPEGYVERQVKGWAERYRAAKTDEVPEVEAVFAHLERHLPKESGAALIHNDFKYDNVVLDPAEPSHIVAVLDWEMATLGDPLMDLGSTLGYWIDPDDPEEHRLLPFGPTALPGNLSRAQVVERYAERSGRAVKDPLFYFVFALVKIAVIAQQIYKRYVDGHTKDERFANLLLGVQILGRTASRALELGRIDRLGA